MPPRNACAADGTMGRRHALMHGFRCESESQELDLDAGNKESLVSAWRPAPLRVPGIRSRCRKPGIVGLCVAPCAQFNVSGVSLHGQNAILRPGGCGKIWKTADS